MSKGYNNNGWLIRVAFAVIATTLGYGFVKIIENSEAIVALESNQINMGVQHGEAIARLERDRANMSRQLAAIGWPMEYHDGMGQYGGGANRGTPRLKEE